jgi:hypothetical protein
LYTHIEYYCKNGTDSSGNIKKIENQHNMAHAPDAFSALRSCEDAGDARCYIAFGYNPMRLLHKSKYILRSLLSADSLHTSSSGTKKVAVIAGFSEDVHGAL